VTANSKIIYLILTLIALGLMLAGPERITSIFTAQDATKIPVSTLLVELKHLSLPETHTVVTQPSSFDKIVATGVSVRVQAASSMAKTIAELEQSLSRQGWGTPSRREVALGEQLKFCKNGMSLVIEPVSQDAPTRYYMGLGWTKFTRSPSFCPVP